MADDKIVVAAMFMCAAVVTAASVFSIGNSEIKCQKRRKFWVRPWIQLSQVHGAYHTLLKELQSVDHESFKNFLRMDFAAFEDLLTFVGHDITKQDTKFRRSLPARERLCIVLRYLATGESIASLHYQFRVGKQTVSQAIYEVCTAVYRRLKMKYLKLPNSPDEWKAVADGFDSRWNFPHCIGALDGKHVVIQKPGKSGSTYMNYKHTFSIVLMAVVDSNYKFLYISVGAQGRLGDAGIFNSCKFYNALRSNALNLPQPASLDGTNHVIPYMVVADDAFPLTPNIMKPFSRRSLDISKRIFNYRLSRARRVVENAFRLLSSKFRVFRAPILLSVPNTTAVVLAAVCLHNFLLGRQRDNMEPYSDASDVKDDNDTETENTDIPKAFRALNYVPGRLNAEGKNTRKNLEAYFMAEGAVNWQYGAIRTKAQGVKLSDANS